MQRSGERSTTCDPMASWNREAEDEQNLKSDIGLRHDSFSPHTLVEQHRNPLNQLRESTCDLRETWLLAPGSVTYDADSRTWFLHTGWHSLTVLIGLDLRCNGAEKPCLYVHSASQLWHKTRTPFAAAMHLTSFTYFEIISVPQHFAAPYAQHPGCWTKDRAPWNIYFPFDWIAYTKWLQEVKKRIRW